MTEVARIIAGFSAAERAMFRRMGGKISVRRAEAPKWTVPAKCPWEIERENLIAELAAANRRIAELEKELAETKW